MEYNVINIFLGISFFLTTVLGTLLLTKTIDKSGKFLAMTSYGAGVWVLSNLLFQISDYTAASAKLMYMAGIFGVVNFVLFAYYFLRPEKQKGNDLFYLYYAIFIIISLIIAFTESIIKDIAYDASNKAIYFFTFGKLYHLYTVIMVGSCVLAYYFIFKTYRAVQDRLSHIQIIDVVISTGLALLVGLVFDIIMPLLGYFELMLLGPISVSFFVVLASYMIFKHHIFDIRAVATETFVFAILVIVFIQIFTAETLSSLFLRFAYFLIILIFTLFLLKSVYREINQREEIERLAGKLRNFVSFTTHELRTPITKFKNGLAFILAGDAGQISKEAKSMTAKLLGVTNEMNHDIETFLNLNKLEIGKLTVNSQPFDINEILEKSVNDFKRQAKEKNIDLSFIKHESVEPVVADKFHIAHVINNLISNAIKYTKDGGRARVYLEEDKKKGRVICTVEDSGIGIPEDVKEQLFQLYERGAKEAKLTAKGSGIGLFLAKKLVEMNKGKLWVESAGKDRGSEFSFYLLTKEM